MKAFRSWLKWIFKGRAALCGLRRELQEQIQHCRIDAVTRTSEVEGRAFEAIQAASQALKVHANLLVELEGRVAALESAKPQSVRESPQVTRHHSFREFQAQVEREEANAD